MKHFFAPKSLKSAFQWIYGVYSVIFDLDLGQSLEWSYGMRLYGKEKQIMFENLNDIF